LRQELQRRKKYGYPPEKLIIKVTIESPQSNHQELIEHAMGHLAKYEPLPVPAFIPYVRNKQITHLLVKIDPEAWPQKNLLDIVKKLSRHFPVEVGATSLL
jgi:primosomal protein N'